MMEDKMQRLIAIVVYFAFLMALSPNIIFAWDNQRTHPDLSEIAARNSILSVLQYLETTGLRGVDEKVNGKEIFKWIRDGAYDEDAGSNWDAVTGKARYVNHFHDPTKPWDSAGLSDMQNGKSSLLWAQDSEKQKVALGGDWSWKRVRECFYTALTGKNLAEELIAQKEWQKEEFFARTFKGLGYQMHLVQDASQPAHVRNDAHPADGGGYALWSTWAGWVEGLETWAKFHSVDVNTFASTPVLPQVPLNASSDQFAPVPITQFVDTGQYRWLLVPSTSLAWGLSEYTNSNFVSDDTIFTEILTPAFKHYFPYPRYSSQCYEMFEETNSATNKKTKYLRKKCDGEPVNHFVTVGPLYKYLGFSQLLQNAQLKLTSAVHRDYAEKLIPRAVGYSAGLLNYFFRGTLEITPPDEYVYSITDGSQTFLFSSTYWDTNGTLQQVWTEQQQFTKIKAKVRNMTQNEEAGQGNLVAVAVYSIIPDYKSDLSNYPPSAQNIYNNSMDYVPYLYSVSAPIPVTSLSSTTAQQFEFDFTNQPIPAGITDFSMYFVFKGTLGNEKDNAIAVAWKDMSEPVHQTFWNLTDRYSLDYILRTSNDIRNSNQVSQADRYLVDLDKNETYEERPNAKGEMEPWIDPYPMSFEISYSGSDPATSSVFPSASVDNLDPGKHIRLIVLVDNPTNPTNYVDLQFTSTINGESDYYATFDPVYNGNYGGTFTTIPDHASTFRKVNQHFNLGIVGCAPMAVNGATGKKFCPYNETEDLLAQTDVTPVPVDTSLFLQNAQ